MTVWMANEVGKAAAEGVRKDPLPETPQGRGEEYVAVLRAIRSVESLRRDLVERGWRLEAALGEDFTTLNQGVDIPGGRVGLAEVRVQARSFVNRPAVEEHEGELPEDLRPVRTESVKAEVRHIDPATLALWKSWDEAKLKEEGIKFSEAVKWPTVAKLKAAGFGESCVSSGLSRRIAYLEPGSEPLTMPDQPKGSDDD